jgi:lipid-A-disaccharide synthase
VVVLEVTYANRFLPPGQSDFLCQQKPQGLSNQHDGLLVLPPLLSFPYTVKNSLRQRMNDTEYQKEFTDFGHFVPSVVNSMTGADFEPNVAEFMGKRIFFSVGEPSGDLHAANLIRSIKNISPSSRFRGLGGSRMIQAGLELDYDLTSLAIMGFAEVLPKYREFCRVADLAEQCFARGDVDGVVLVDFPGFNWHIAKRAKKYNLPVFYYLPPQLWAWGGWRVHKLRKSVDHVFCNLPFETPWFQRHQVPATYVGHPFFDAIAQQPLDVRFIDRWKNNRTLQVAVLPGSRDREVHTIWPLQLEVIRRLASKFPHVQFMVAALKDSHALWCRSQLRPADAKLPIHIFAGKTSEIIELSDCSIMKSGSVSLEMMARGKPAAVMYHLSQLTFAFAKLFVRCKCMSIPNLMSEEEVLAESLSHGKLNSRSARRSVDNVTQEMSRLLSDDEYRATRRRKLLALASQFAKPGASNTVAKLIMTKLIDPDEGTLPMDEERIASNVPYPKAA